MSEKTMQQITFLCNRIHNREWSGIMFFKSEGNPATDDFTIDTDKIFLLDIGSAAWTDYELEPEDIMTIYDENPHYIEEGYRMAHIHSHVDMATGFSGTDTDTLRKHAKDVDFFLSVIVNNKGDINAKYCIEETVEVDEEVEIYNIDKVGWFSLTDLTLGFTKKKDTKKVKKDRYAIYTLDVEEDFEAGLSDKINELRRSVSSSTKYPSYNGYQGTFDFGNNDDVIAPFVKFAITGNYNADDQEVEFTLIDIIDKLASNEVHALHPIVIKINDRIKYKHHALLIEYLEDEAKDITYKKAAEFLLNNLELKK